MCKYGCNALFVRLFLLFLLNIETRLAPNVPGSKVN